MSLKLLIADDDCKILRLAVEQALADMGEFQISLATTPDQCLEAIQTEMFDFILLDLSFSIGRKEGLDLLPEVVRHATDAEIIMLTSFDDPSNISTCMALGAHDYIPKENLETPTLFRSRIEAAMNRKNKRDIDDESGKKIASKVGANFKSRVMQDVYAQVAKVRSQSRMHVLITGQTGTGKELVARAIGREDEGAPFFPVNSSCFGQDLLEGELFGHERGSFTGADRQKIGLFELANDGDIFLDEIATLSQDHQAKLLRVLQSGEYYRIGGTKVLKTSARVIAATNEDLEALIRQGKFREDLLQRLQRYHIQLPPLVERKEDIPLIVENTIKRSQKPKLKLSKECLNILMEYSWPRNVRELEDVVTAMIMNSDGAFLTVGDMPKKFFDVSLCQKTESNESSDTFINCKIKIGKGLDDALKDFNAQYILAVANTLKHPVNTDKLARALGMPRTTLQSRLRSFDIDLASVLPSFQNDGGAQ